MNRTLLIDLKTVFVLSFAERPGVTFQITDVIGRGASCVVYHAICSDNTEHLLKEYYPKNLPLMRDGSGQILVPDDKQRDFDAGLVRFRSGCERQKVIRLSNRLKNFTCNVQGYYRANGTEYIDMTCFDGRTYDHVQEKSVYELMLRMRTLTQVVGNYHKAGLLHLDIKPENIFVRTEGETVEDVMLFDFDSVTSMRDIFASKGLSCSKSWAAPEQKTVHRQREICPATDLFAIGEIIFVQLFGRVPKEAECRSYVRHYEYDHSAAIFENMNPKVFPLLDDLFCHTICGVVKQRYQSAEELIDKIQEIIRLSDPREPYLKSSALTMQEFFVGREKEIEEIHQKLSEDRILFLNGIGGIGKSELAKRYAEEHGDEYDTIIFASYISDVNMLIQDDTAIPLYNFAPYPEEKPEDYCARKLKKLTELCDERTLFIVDNLDRDDDPDLKKLLNLGAKLLITTRMDFEEYGIGQQLSLDALQDRAEIRRIFDKYYTKPMSAADESCVEQIIDLVAGHTMTVELLAKQMMAGRVKPDKMLAKLQEGGISESGKEKVRSGKDGVLSAHSTYAHIQTLFDLSGLNEEERYILANLSLIPYTGISTELFRDWCELSGYSYINGLVTGGWIFRNTADIIMLHPLIADNLLTIQSGSNTIFDRMLHNVKKWVSDSNLRGLSSQERKSRAEMVLTIANRLVVSAIETLEIASFLSRVPSLFWKFGKLQYAILCRNRALQLRVKMLGEMHSDTATSYHNLGRMYKEQNEYEKAEQYYNKSLEIRCTLFGEEHGDTAISYSSLGVLYKELKRYDVAEEYGKKALQIRVALFGEQHEDVATSCNNLGVLYKEIQQYTVAEQYHLRALRIRKYLFGEKHEDTANSFNNLGTLYREWNRLNDAEQYLLKALEVRHCIFGEIHSSTAATCANLGDLYRDWNEFGSAKKFYEKTLEIRTAILGENHKKTMRVKSKIAKLPAGPTHFDVRQENVRIVIQKILESSNPYKSTRFSKERCPDQIVAKISVSRSKKRGVCVEFDEVIKTKNQKQSIPVIGKPIFNRVPIRGRNSADGLARIVLILESPHKEEFNPSNSVTPVNGPAYDKTGDNINEWLSEMLPQIMDDTTPSNEMESYEIALVNTIQYQCSLGEKTSKYRDKTLWKCWKHKAVRLDFCERVRCAIGTHTGKSIIINCCTTGKLHRSNHDLVNIALDDMEISFYESTHPYGWFAEENRWIRKHDC